MFRRHFKMCPPSFIKHYQKYKMAEGGWRYMSRYTSIHGLDSIINGVNHWFDYIGTIVMHINADLDDMEIEARRDQRRVLRDPPRTKLPSRKEDSLFKREQIQP